MYKRYYDGYNRSYQPKEQGEIVVPENMTVSNEISENETDILTKADEIVLTGVQGKKNLLSLPCEIDDIILIGILLFLLLDKGNDESDPVLLIILGFILLSDIF